ncbi:MAG: zinc ribbon domain-containing protein, partial [Desulfobacterales bacterium]
KSGFAMLAECYVKKDDPAVLNVLLDSNQPNRVRQKAAEMMGDIGELEAIEPLKNSKFGNEIVQKEVDQAIKKIHERFFTRECPFCAEIIKKRAKICKHCQKEVAGV